MIKMTDSEFKYLVDNVKRNYGIDLSRKRVLLEGRLGNYLAQQGFNDYSSYIKFLEADKSGKELTTLLNKITTNHTYFMRESSHFDFFKGTVLPQLETRVRDRDLRVWCAASSTGEEPYTLAMILQDHFGKMIPQWDKTLLATDLSMKVLDQATHAVYPAESIHDVPAAWKSGYFEKVDKEHVRVVEKIRREVIFRRFNLMDPIVAKKPFHVIFCRNVMIYFDTPTKSALINRLYDCMQPGGYLFVGLTESIPNLARFKSIMPSVYQKGV